MDKVKITREQADLLDDLLPRNNVKWIFSHLAEWQNVEKTTVEMARLHHWYIEDPLTVSKAMIIGYEVELSKEDRVRLAVKEYCNGAEVSQWIIDQIREIYEGVNHV